MSAMKQPQRGDLVYDERGGEYQYVAKHPDGRGHIVLTWYERDDSDEGPSEYCGEPTLLQCVFFGEDGSNGIRQKTDAQLADVLEKIATARKELQSIEQAKREADREVVERRERLKQHEKLKLLDDYLSDRITHFAIGNYEYPGIRIETKEAALEEGDGNRSIRLLSLYGNSKGDLHFNISRYSDGSGSTTHCMPFTNEADAIAYAQGLVTTGIKRCMNAGSRFDGVPYSLESWIKDADRFGVPVDDELRSLQRNASIKSAEAYVAKVRADLAAAVANLDIATGTP